MWTAARIRNKLRRVNRARRSPGAGVRATGRQRCAVRRRARQTASSVVGVALLIAAACSQPSAAGTSPSPTAGPGSQAPTAGLVDIGGGRTIWLECRGTGTPTVLLVSGAVGAHDDWTHTLNDADPAAAPSQNDAAVFSEVSRFTRVCAYDRPGTTRLTGELSPSTPVPQPTTAQAGASDLRALMSAAGERGPYVLVGASWGGMLVNLFARENHADVAALVLVDGASDSLEETLTPGQWAAWMQAVATSPVPPGGEIPDYDGAVAEIRAAPALPSVPAVVLTADQPWNLSLGDQPPTWPAWTAAQDRLADQLHATHVTATDSGHPINLQNPRVVVDAVRSVVDTARGTPGPAATTR